MLYYGDNYYAYDRLNEVTVNFSRQELKDMIFNHVTTALPDGSANKEFLPTLGGIYISWDHTSNTVEGNVPCTVGYHGFKTVPNYPLRLDEPCDNGETWRVRYWISFKHKDMSFVLAKYSGFLNYLRGQAYMMRENLHFLS